MARKRYSDEDILKLLREIELNLAAGSDVATACGLSGLAMRLTTTGARGLAAWASRSCRN
jgi:hypothetical protein